MDGAETSNQRENLRGRHFVAGPIIGIGYLLINIHKSVLLGSFSLLQSHVDESQVPTVEIQNNTTLQ